MPIDVDTAYSDFGDSRVPARFWSNVAVLPNGCWEWRGYRSEDGYGRYGNAPRPDGRSQVAHRFIVQALGAEVAATEQVDHLCHDPAKCAGGDTCPHRACVNPRHLAVVAPRVNVLRSNGLAAANVAKTHCPVGHALAGDNLRVDGRKRRCVTCRREQCRRASLRYLARKAAVA